MRKIANNHFGVIFGIWSDHISLVNLPQELNMPCEHLHVLGEKIPTSDGLKSIVAKRHFAGISKKVMPCSDLKINNWSKVTLQKSSVSNAFVEMLDSADVEATLWISVLGDTYIDDPALSDEIIDQAKTLKISILVENYTYIHRNICRSWILRFCNTAPDVP